MIKIKAIVFDCFGVLTSDGWLPFARKYFSHDPVLYQEARDLNKQNDAGLITFAEFVQEVAALAGVQPQVAYQDIENNVTNDDIFILIAGLKKSYKIGMLSNAGDNWINELFTPEQVALFDAIVLSSEIGVVKPDPKMYLTVAEKLGVEPVETVFIDDIERYVAGAKDVGMQGIWFKDTEQLAADLTTLLESHI